MKLVHEQIKFLKLKAGYMKINYILFTCVCVIHRHTHMHIYLKLSTTNIFLKTQKEKEIKAGHHSKVLKKWSKHMELDIVSHKLSSF